MMIGGDEVRIMKDDDGGWRMEDDGMILKMQSQSRRACLRVTGADLVMRSLSPFRQK